MNITLIILGVVILILLYILYTYYSKTTTTLISTASLKATNPPITSVANATNSRYAYGIWVYVNSWDNNAQKVIFSRNNNISVSLDTLTPSLYCNVTMSDNVTQKKVLVTDNFPLQKWVFVIISLDNQFLDCYIDGKLIKSSRLGSSSLIPATPPDEKTPIILGGLTSKMTPFDAVVAKFSRWTVPMDPTTAWNTYMAGNGGSVLGNNVSSFGANVSILKNNIEYSKMTLF